MRFNTLFIALALTLASMAVAPGCAKPVEVVGGELCVPDELIFCRCNGGTPGTKRCLQDGDAFGPCENCQERPSAGPGAQSSGPGATVSSGVGPGGAAPHGSSAVSSSGAGGAAASSSAGTGGSQPMPGNTPLLGACALDSDCQSLQCRHGYCTKICKQVSDCPYPQSECVPLGPNTVCMPTCQTAINCAPYQAPPSMCGYTQAIDNWGVTVCAEWGAAHQLTPLATDCLPYDHEACNLGYLGTARVCSEQGVCTGGCYTNSDCPMGTSCTGQGMLGSCQ